MLVTLKERGIDIVLAVSNKNIFKTNCTGRRDVAAAREDEVATCTPDDITGAISRLCRGDIELEGGMTIAQCIADPYHADCGNDLFNPARLAVVKNCFDNRKDATPATGCGTEVANGLTVAQCINNPFHLDCADAGFDVARGDRDTLCGAKTAYFDPLCDAYAGIDTTRAEFVNECIDNKDRATNMDCAAFVNACLDDPYIMDGETCKDPAFAGARLTHCGIGDNVQDVPQCGELDTANNGCIANPFATACVADYRALRTVRVDYCKVLGTAAEGK